MTEDPLAALRAHPERAGLFLDFDGTLSRIVHRPSEARPFEGATDVLDGLATHYRVVAIVSGRSAAELLEWLGPGVEIWGTHGSERTANGRVSGGQAFFDGCEERPSAARTWSRRASWIRAVVPSPAQRV